MKIQIQSINFSAALDLKQFINKKMNKLSSLDYNLIKADIFLKLERLESYENKMTEIRIHSSKSEYFAKKQCDTFEQSVDLAIQAIRKQVLKSKGKI